MTPVPRVLTDAERFDWLRLIRSEAIGPRTFFGLLGRFRTARAAIEALPGVGGRSVKLAVIRDIEEEMERARRVNIHFVAACEPAYPPSLRVIDSAPPIIAVKGRLDVLQRSMVAIVGSRNASAAGMVLTERIARGLGEAGHVVVSGLARGIDQRAHLASLATGTVAVLAGGHDRIYPSEHKGLAARIVETGAVISEMPIAWEPRGRDFPRRNRIVSGLSFGVVVVEAARRSGSLITARFALEQGREVFAVPGSPLEPRAEGTNDLLRQGATFCTGAEDVVSVLQPMTSAHVPVLTMMERDSRVPDTPAYWDEADLDGPSPQASLGDEIPSEPDETSGEQRAAATPRSLVLDLIGTAPVSVDELVRVAALSPQVVQAAIVELELDGLIDRHGTGLVSRVPSGHV